MKKILFAISLVLLASCSVKTNEEKARELIEAQVKSSLIKPESYEFAQIQLDSCFSDSQQNPEVIAFAMKVAKLFNEYKDYTSDAERAESSMTIYAPSYGYQDAHSKQQQKKYKAEMEKARRKAADTKEQIIQLYRDNKKLFTAFQSGKHEFIGWMAVFGYRITNRFTEDDMRDMQSADLDDLKYEFEDELKDIFGDK